MSDIDQTGVIEQLTAENTLLRETLRHSPDREIQLASALMLVLDELTRLGPAPAQRVLMWGFRRYGIDQHIYARDITDRRPKPATPPQPAEKSLERRHLLRKARVAAGLTQTVLAERSGVAAPRISMIELGNSKPSEEVWQRLENAIKEVGANQ